MAANDVSFLFQIDEIRQVHHENSPPPRADKFGRWLPPDTPAGHIQVEQGITGKIYRWDNGTISPTKFMATSPAFQLASVYHCQSVFYTVSHDVRKGKCEKDWGILRFRHGPGSTSSLTMGSHDRRLATQSFNQAWAWDLFPDALRSQDVTGDQGGLKGNLALILALAAFSAQPNNVEDALKTGFKKGHWVRHNLPDGRRDERGVVVLVYEDPGRSSASILRGFEEGLVFA